MNKVLSAETMILASRIECIKGLLFGTKTLRPANMGDEEFGQYTNQLVNQATVFIGNEDIEPLTADELFKAANDLSGQASWQESAAVLNPNYNLTKNDVLRKQAEVLRNLALFVKGLKEIHDLKLKAQKEDSSMEAIRSMFM